MSGNTPSAFDTFNTIQAESRLRSSLMTPADAAISAKQSQVADSTASKVETLRAIARERETAKSSWAGQLGLDAPEGVAHAVVNLTASAVSGGSRALGDIATTPLDLNSMLGEAQVPQEVTDAFASFQNGTATPEQAALLEQRAPMEAQSKLSQAHMEARNRILGKAPEPVVMGATYKERLTSAGATRAAATAVDHATDLSSIVDQRSRNELSGDIAYNTSDGLAKLKEAAVDWDDNKIDAVVEAISGLSDIILGAGDAILENPMAAAEFAAEQIPDMVIGKGNKALLDVRNLGYGIEQYRLGIVKYQAENAGRLPDAGERQYMLLNAIAAGASEALGDKVLLGVGGAVADTASKVGLLKRALNVATEGGKSVVSESATEAVQTYFEGEAGLNPATAEQIIEGATIGAAAGGGVSTVMAGAQQLGEGATVSAETRITNAAKLKAQAEAAIAGKETGDVSPLTDPTKTETYNPGIAAHALSERFRREDLTPEEKTATKQQLETLVQDLDTKVSDQQDQIDLYNPAVVANAKKQLVAAETTLASAAAGSDEQITAQSNIEVYGAQVAAAEELDSADLPALKTTFEETKSHLEQARKAATDLIAQTAPKAETVDDLISTTEMPEASPERESASAKIVELMMADPESLSEHQLDKLVSNESNGLAPEQREYLRTLSDARIKMNALADIDSVNAGVMTGTKGFKGLAQYTRDISQALTSGNQKSLQREMSALGRFYTSHARKAELFPKIVDTLQNFAQKGHTRATVYLVNDYNAPGGWKLATVEPDGDYRANGGMVFSATEKRIAAAQRLATSTKAEAEAIQATREQARLANELKFNPKIDTSTVHVEKAPVLQPKVEPVTPVAEAAVVPTEVVEDAAVQSKETELSQDELDLIAELKGLEQTITEEPAIAASKAVLEGIPTLSGNLKQEAFKGANLLGYFTQTATREESTSSNPLVATENFLSSVLKNVESAFDYLGAGKATAAQINLMETFAKLATRWNKAIAKNTVVDSSADFRYTDLLQFFDGKLPENWMTAISYGAFSWLGEAASGSMFNNDETINAILLRPDNTIVEPEERALLLRAGTRQNLIIQDLGKRIASALGIKADPNAPANIKPQLELSLGAHALAVMLQAGLVERHELALNIKNDKDGETTVEAGTGAPTYFVRVAQQGDVINPAVVAIVDAHANTSGVLHSLFSVESSLKAPSLEPEKVTQPTTKGTRQGVPGVLRKILNAVGKRGYTIRTDMKKVRDALSEDTVMKIAGALEIDQSFVHTHKLDKMEAQNDSIALDIRRLNEFEAEHDIKSPFYFLSNVWSVQRVGLKQNLINPQGSKFHRHNISMEAWKTEVALNDDDMVERFKLAVAQGMGIKVDKQPIAASVAQVEAMIADEVFQDAIDALVRAQSLAEGEKLTDQEQRFIFAAVEGRENFHTLDALVNWANYQVALFKGESFTTEIIYEVDGVTNGPALAHVLLGTIGAKLAEKFGMYTEESTANNYAEWKQVVGNQDLYEDVMDGVMTELSADTTIAATLKAAVFHFTKDLRTDGKITSAGRNQVKQPVTSMVFGAGVDTTVDNMASAFVELFYDKLEEAANNGSMDELANTVAQFNTFMTGSNKIRVPASFEAAMQLELSKSQQDQMADAFVGVMGKHVKNVMEGKFKSFMEARKELNQAAQATWKMYDVVFNYMRDKRIAELVKSKDLPAAVGKDGRDIPLQDLSQAELDGIREQLKDIEPIVHTPLSKMSDDLSSGIYIAKLAQTIATEEDRPYTAQPKFGQPVPVVPGERGKNSVTGLKARAMKATEVNPGVRLVIMLVHSLDSAISALSYKETPALNLHDANGTGIADMFDAAQRLNQNAFNVLADYSLPMEIAAAYQRTLTGITKMVAENPELLPLLKEAQKFAEGKREDQFASKNDPIDVLTEFGAQLEINAVESEKVKLDFLSKITIMDQYAQEGGSHEVTDEERAKVVARLKELGGKVTDAPVNAEIDLVPPRVGDTPWGLLGQAKNESNANLESVLKAHGTTDLRSLRTVLRSEISASTSPPKVKEFQLALLAQLNLTADMNTAVNYIAANTPSPTKKTNVRSARGWYNVAKKTINIKSSEFVNSGITPELMLHEMTHAALAQFIEANPEHAAVKELEQLRELAIEYVNDRDLNQHKEAVKNIHEFVAWGMTNMEFQVVLANITMPNTAAARTKESGLRGFIRNLVKILFKGTNIAMAENGLAIMIANTGLMFEAATAAPASEGPDLILRMADPLNYTSAQTLEALSQVNTGRATSDSFGYHLQTILTTVVETVYGPFGVLKSMAERNATVTVEDTFLNSMASGEAPFAFKAAGQLPLNSQEAFVMESVEVTMREALRTEPLIHRELKRLFKDAQRQIKPANFHNGDWSLASPDEIAEAQNQYDFVFNLEQNEDGTSDYLSRFAAIGLAHEPVNRMLRQLDGQVDVETFKGKNLAQMLKLLYDKVMNALAYRYTQTFAGQRPDQRLEALSRRVAAIEARKKSTVASFGNTAANVFDRATHGLNEAARGKISKIAGSDFFKKSKIGAVRAVGSLTSAAVNGRLGLIMEAIQISRNKAMKSRQGTLSAMLSELQGIKDKDIQFLVLQREVKNIEQERKTIKDTVTGMVKKAFGRNLSQAEMSALTRVAIRTDMANLLEQFDLAQLEKLLTNPVTLDLAIQAEIAKLSGANAGIYQNRAQDLGVYMATHKAANKILAMNAHNIAHMFGTDQVGTVSDADANAAIPVIDTLASLYAIKYVPGGMKQVAAEIFAEEAKRKDKQNGVELILKLHKNFQDEAKQTLFADGDAHFMKGYTKEIFNPYIKVVEATPEKGAQLMQAGWEKVRDLKKDKADIRPDQYSLYVLRDGGNTSLISGALALTGKDHRGSEIHGGNINLKSTQRINADIAHLNKPAIAAMMTARPLTYNPLNTLESVMVPTFNLKGEIVTYRYVMDDISKDTLLERNNSVDQVLGTMAGHALDKASTEEQNNNVIKALHEKYKAEVTKNPEAFLEFSELSSDETIREAFRLLPDATKAEIKRVWGRSGMRIRSDLFDITVGYRKFSAATMFKKDEDVRNTAEKIVVGIVESLAGKKSALYVARSEDMWQATVKEIKDLWVVKNLFTFIGNLKFNIIQQMAMGVPLVDIIKGHVTSAVGIINYQRDHKELLEVQFLLAAAHTGQPDTALQQRLIELQDSLSRNPVKELVDAGLYHTIAEDIDSEEDTQQYKSKIHRFVDSGTSRLPSQVRRIGRTLYMTHDTPLYKVLSRMTHIGDFMARYTVYQHVTKRKVEPLSKVEAIELVDRAFVNYDTPTNRNLQYLNDMGLMPFTKYYMRMQAVLFQIYKDNPGRVLALSTLHSMFNWIPSMSDPLLWEWLGRNPGGIGPLNFPSALGEAITVKSILSPF